MLKFELIFNVNAPIAKIQLFYVDLLTYLEGHLKLIGQFQHA